MYQPPREAVPRAGSTTSASPINLKLGTNVEWLSRKGAESPRPQSKQTSLCALASLLEAAISDVSAVLLNPKIVGDGERTEHTVGFQEGDVLVHFVGHYTLQRHVAVLHDNVN